MLMAKEVIVISYAPTKAELREIKHHLRLELQNELEKHGVALRTMRFGDRYALVIDDIPSAAIREHFLKLFATRFDDIFFIHLPERKKEPALTDEKGASSVSRILEWVAFVALSMLLLFFFVKGVREMLTVRRSQRVLRHEQMKIENELRKKEL